MGGIRINGNLFYPKMSEARKKVIKDKKLGIWNPRKKSRSEFELQAITYCKLRDYIKNDKLIKGEYFLKSKNCQYLFDIVLLHKEKILCIIEIKRNEIIAGLEDSKRQIESYSKIAPVIVIYSLKQAENIISILFNKKLLPTSE